jgi:hypothetical protein
MIEQVKLSRRSLLAGAAALFGLGRSGEVVAQGSEKLTVQEQAVVDLIKEFLTKPENEKYRCLGLIPNFSKEASDRNKSTVKFALPIVEDVEGDSGIQVEVDARNGLIVNSDELSGMFFLDFLRDTLQAEERQNPEFPQKYSKCEVPSA